MKNYIFLGLAMIIANLSLAQNSRNTAEVFIQIADRGSFTVYLDNEFIGSANGKFRFYDIYNRSSTLSIVQGNKKIFTKQITTNPGERLVLNYSARQGLRTIKTLQIYRNGQYALNDFDDYVGAYNTGIVPPRGNGAGVNTNLDSFNQLSQRDFDLLLASVKNEAFDDNRTKIIQAATRRATLTTAQVAALLKFYSFEDKALSLAKSLYPSVSDQQRYFTLKEIFKFKSNQDALLDF